MSGVLDWFGKKKAPKSQLPILREGGEVIPLPQRGQLPAVPKRTLKEQLLSLFEPFEPGHPTLPEIRKSLNLVPEQINLPAPIDIVPEEIKESPEPETYEERVAKQEDVWKGMFEETTETPSQMFEVFQPSPIPEEEPQGYIQPTADELVEALRRQDVGRQQVPAHEYWPLNVPPLYWSLNWRIPTPFEIAHYMQTHPEEWDLPGLFEFTMQNTDYPGWRREVEESPHTGEPARLEISMVAHWSSAYEDLGKFLHIPKKVMDRYFEEVHDEEEAADRGMMFEVEVVRPYIENISKALDALRPPNLKGYYNIEPAEDLSWWLVYEQGKFSSGG